MMSLYCKSGWWAFLLVILPAVSISAQAEPKFPAPNKAQVSWVGKDLEFNGLPLRARKYTTADSVASVLKFYRRLWKRPSQPGLPGYIEQDLGEWKMITRYEDGYMLTVQVKPYLGSGAWGYLGEGKLDAVGDNSKGTLATNFPKMNGSQIINDIKHKDSYKNARTVMLQNNFSISSNAQYYRDYYMTRGWNAVINKTTVPGYMHTFLFQKGVQEVSMSIARTEKGSQVVANVIE